MAQNQAQTNSLESIYSDSFPANHLLQISMVKQASEESYKKQYFCFVTLAPGEQTQGGGRTFNFQNRINLKVDAHKIRALGHALMGYAQGREAVIGPFSIFVDSSKSQYGQGGGGKSIGLQRTVNQKQNNAPVIILYFKSGSNSALAFTMSPADAMSLADSCEFIGKKCQELEFSRVQAAAHTGTFPNANVGTPPVMSPPNQTITNTPNNVLNNFSNGFENFSSAPPEDFGDSPF